MLRFDRIDIILELLELSQELHADIIQQLNYYRASVYKGETAKIIDQKIDQLKTITSLINDEDSLDFFNDFEATKQHGNVAIAPGECLFTRRVTQLLNHLAESNLCLKNAINDQQLRERIDPSFTKRVKQQKRKLLQICKQGSRRWSFFQTV